MAYFYRGTNTADEAGEYTHDPLRCGTFEGYRKHKRNQETICPPCREAKRVKSAADYAKKTADREANPPVFDPSKCGTYAGYRQHVRHKNTKCEPCRESYKAYMADYREKRKATDPYWRAA